LKLNKSMPNKDLFQIGEYIFKKKIDKDIINQKVTELAQRINDDYRGKDLTFIIVLRGAFVFAADLIRNIELPTEVFFVDSKSYGNNLQSSGKVNLNLGDIDLVGRDVIIIEDIVDSGHTLKKLTAAFKIQKPNSIQIAAILSKPAQREVEIDVKYVGFEIPPDFVVGYGLDYDEKGRHLPHIYSKI